GKSGRMDMRSYRDVLFVATKAGYRHWPGPYGEWGSKKNLIASCDNSLKRLGLDYVDLFYHHRPDRETPVEETIEALEQIVRSGKALYVGISNYDSALTENILNAMEAKGIHCLVHQVNYSMFDRRPEEKLMPVLEKHGVGAAAYMCLAQGILTDRYFEGVKEGSRAAGNSVFLNEDQVTDQKVATAKELNEIAKERGQSLAQMALAWCYRISPVTTLIIGASRLSQIDDNLKAMGNLTFSEKEIKKIDEILAPYAREAY
ncbi:MAG: aldo/keto reductase, partial [Lachnospiraceae bacterium]|nr:aldo/keto reductase [Lachnospiraceae bacterium]